MTEFQFKEKPFYGGAVKGFIPEGWIDASDIRQIPDHQEVFLSSTTLTNLIVEINEFLHTEEIPEPPSRGEGPQPTVDQMKDIDACVHYLQEICDEEEQDTVQLMRGPTRLVPSDINITSQLARSCAALEPPVNPRIWMGLAEYSRPKQGADPKLDEQMAKNWKPVRHAEDDPDPREASLHSSHYLLVRLPEKEADFLFIVNVPHEEFVAKRNFDAMTREQHLAGDLLMKLTENMDIVDWKLFGQ